METSPVKTTHLFRLNERIQRKYKEMQRRLEKSRSVDSLSTASDDFSYSEPTYASNYDLRESDEMFKNETETVNRIEQSITEDNIHKHSAVSEVIEYTEARYVETELKSLIANTTVEDYWEIIEHDSIDPRVSVSLESLYSIGKDSDDSSVRPTPSPRTIRDRIESRFHAVKEKREQRRLEKERLSKERQLKEKSREKVEKFILSNSAKDIAYLRTNKKVKVATLTIALIEATNLEPVTDERMRLLQCRFRLGTEKYKSKVLKSSSTKVKWQELFNLNMNDELIMLETSLYDKDTFLGRYFIDLTTLEKEKTHKLKFNLDGDMPDIQIFLLLTISGISFLNTVTEIDDVQNVQRTLEVRNNGWYRLENDLSDVGWLSVIVYGAKGLVSQDCYCVLKLANERLQTHTEYKTYDPNWMKIFTFQLADITSILEVSVVEEKKVEEIGKISIPLLRIRNGVRVWYALKDLALRERARGNNPRILIEMRTSWHLGKAAFRVINPKEPDLLATDAKFDRRVFARNISRARTVTKQTLDSLKIIKTCFEWESKRSNVIALITWILFCYFFKIWMLPLLFLIPFVKNRPEKYYLVNWRKLIMRPDNGALEHVKNEKEEKSTLRQKINSLQEMVQTVQTSIGKMASLGESVKNLCNFTVPFVSLFAIFLILLTSFIMYLIPLKYILICWGIHKFTRKILRPNRIPNSEILDLLSRVPDDETLLDCEELPLECNSDDESI